MLTTAQRIDVLKIAVDMSKTMYNADGSKEPALDKMALDIFQRLKAEVERGDALDDADMTDVKAAVDVAASLGGLIE